MRNALKCVLVTLLFVLLFTFGLQQYLLSNTSCITDTECDQYWKYQE